MSGRKRLGCLGTIATLLLVLIWFVIALNVELVKPTGEGFSLGVQFMAYIAILIPRLIMAVFGFDTL